jgi:hypothetical protein
MTRCTRLLGHLIQLRYTVLMLFAAVAQQAGCTLISLANEHLTRLGSIVMVRTPAAVLAELIPPRPHLPPCDPLVRSFLWTTGQ